MIKFCLTFSFIWKLLVVPVIFANGLSKAWYFRETNYMITLSNFFFKTPQNCPLQIQLISRAFFCAQMSRVQSNKEFVYVRQKQSNIKRDKGLMHEWYATNWNLLYLTLTLLKAHQLNPFTPKSA